MRVISLLDVLCLYCIDVICQYNWGALYGYPPNYRNLVYIIRGYNYTCISISMDNPSAFSDKRSIIHRKFITFHYQILYTNNEYKSPKQKQRKICIDADQATDGSHLDWNSCRDSVLFDVVHGDNYTLFALSLLVHDYLITYSYR